LRERVSARREKNSGKLGFFYGAGVTTESQRKGREHRGKAEKDVQLGLLGRNTSRGRAELGKKLRQKSETEVSGDKTT